MVMYCTDNLKFQKTKILRAGRKQLLIGGFPIIFKTEIRYLKIGGYHIFIL